MFVTDRMIDGMAARYGSPLPRSFEIPTSPKEIRFIRSTQKNGRNHDVTIYTIKDEQVIVTAKHFYPPELYRAPSGGLNPGESFEAGIAREMSEEIGCVVELERFLLHTSVRFAQVSDKSVRHTPTSEQAPRPPLSRGEPSNDDPSIEWRSFVFLAKYISGEFEFTDKDEIREVRLANWSEFELFGKIMRESDKAGLHYRAKLHEAVVEAVQSE